MTVKRTQKPTEGLRKIVAIQEVNPCFLIGFPHTCDALSGVSRRAESLTHSCCARCLDFEVEIPRRTGPVSVTCAHQLPEPRGKGKTKEKPWRLCGSPNRSE